jgi:hypothetical protein
VSELACRAQRYNSWMSDVILTERHNYHSDDSRRVRGRDLSSTLSIQADMSLSDVPCLLPQLG